MIKLITWLVARYNKKAEGVDRIEMITATEKEKVRYSGFKKAKEQFEKEKLEVTTISRMWMEMRKGKDPVLRHVIDRDFVDWIIKEYNEGIRNKYSRLQLRPTEITGEYIEHLVTEFNIRGRNAKYRIDLVTKDNLKDIKWLIDRYNEVHPDDPTELFKPIIFEATTTSKIDTTLYKTKADKKFLNDIVGEKKYDLRQELIHQMYLSGDIKEQVEIKKQEIFIKLSIKAFSYGKKN